MMSEQELKICGRIFLNYGSSCCSFHVRDLLRVKVNPGNMSVTQGSVGASFNSIPTSVL